MASATTLSNNDSHVLGALFDPESSLSNTCQIKNIRSELYDSSTLTHLKHVELQALTSVNNANPSNDDISRAIQILDRLIEEHPRYASAYNNRAEARRISCDTKGLMHQADMLAAILADLGQAISLATPEHDVGIVSENDAAVLAAAHTHRGFLLYLASQMDVPEHVLAKVDGLAGLNREQLEERASRDFAAGGRYGNKMAKQLAVKTNPYAKLCGNVMKEAMRREFESMQPDGELKSRHWPDFGF